jgi:hypothetical protein
MALTTNIIRTWRGPRRVMEGFLTDVPSEARAFGFLVVGCFLVFVAQWPRLSRRVAGFEAVPTDEPPVMEQLVAYEFLSWMVVWPLFMFLIAAIIHAVGRALKRSMTPYQVRLSLFWSFLAASPLLMLHGLMAGFFGYGSETTIVGAAWLAGFSWILAGSLKATGQE